MKKLVLSVTFVVLAHSITTRADGWSQRVISAQAAFGCIEISSPDFSVQPAINVTDGEHYVRLSGLGQSHFELEDDQLLLFIPGGDVVTFGDLKMNQNLCTTDDGGQLVSAGWNDIVINPAIKMIMTQTAKGHNLIIQDQANQKQFQFSW